MRLHYLQHVPFEGPANIEAWSGKQGFTISGTKLFEREALPTIGAFDWLVVMGGPMNIYEEADYPWLVPEKRLIAEAIAANKVVIGVCLGAQLVSDVLKGKVHRNPQKEIGWFPVSLTSEAKESPVFSGFPDRFMAFHWHGDTFHLPEGAVRTAFSEACAVQAFSYNQGRVIGLQFHLESSRESIRLLLDNCREELVEGDFIQTEAEILAGEPHLPEINGTMSALLNALKKTFS